MKRTLILMIAGLMISACTWVELSDEGKKIRVVSMDDVKTCKKVGTVKVALKHQIAGFDRNEEKVKRELEHLARNTTVRLEMDGDSIVPISEIKEGKQSFAVYKCVDPEGHK